MSAKGELSCKMCGVLGLEAWRQGVSNLQNPPPPQGETAVLGLEAWGQAVFNLQSLPQGKVDYGDPIARENRSMFLLVSGCG